LPSQNEIVKGSKDILLPYQVRWLADRARVKVAEKSRRVGFTWTEAADSALSAAARAGMDTWYLGYNKDMAREFIETAAQWAHPYMPTAAYAQPGKANTVRP
jgi:phage FluMu gp28-like protein